MATPAKRWGPDEEQKAGDDQHRRSELTTQSGNPNRVLPGHGEARRKVEEGREPREPFGFGAAIFRWVDGVFATEETVRVDG